MKTSTFLYVHCYDYLNNLTDEQLAKIEKLSEEDLCETLILARNIHNHKVLKKNLFDDYCKKIADFECTYLNSTTCPFNELNALKTKMSSLIFDKNTITENMKFEDEKHKKTIIQLKTLYKKYDI